MVAEVEREIPLRELRNNISKVMREVEEGARFRVTVNGRPVADLTPVSKKRTWVPRAELRQILRDSPPDPTFKADVDSAIGQYNDETWPDE